MEFLHKLKSIFLRKGIEVHVITLGDRMESYAREGIVFHTFPLNNIVVIIVMSTIIVIITLWPNDRGYSYE